MTGYADLQRRLDTFTDEARALISQTRPDAWRIQAAAAALDSTLRTLCELLR